MRGGPTARVLIAACAAAVACGRPPPPGPERVALRFGWPAGAAATVAVHRESHGPIMGQTMDTALELSSSAREGHVRVAIRGAPFPEGATSAPSVALALVADDRGRPLRLEGTEALDHAAEEWAREAMTAEPPARPEQRAFLAFLVAGTRRAALAQAASLAQDEWDAWRRTVDAWAGRTLEAGREYTETGAWPSELDGAVRRQTRRFALRGRVPCPGQPGLRCVELWSRTVPDVATLKAACVASAWPRDQDWSLEVTVVAHPDTLLPFRMTSRLEARALCGMDLGAGSTAIERTWRWTRPDQWRG